MIIVNLIAWGLFVYLAYFVIYRLIIVLKSAKGKMFDVGKREHLPKYQSKLTVVIYSHNNSLKTKTLVESFSKQNYSRDKYSINVVLDNCNNENIKLLEILGGARLWRINTDVKPIGKYKAFAWFLQRIRAVENTNAFVLIDADSVIRSDFLEKVNSNLYDDAIIAGETVKRKNFFLNKLVNTRNKIKNRVIRHGRYYSSLGNIIDTDVLVIKQGIIEKIGFDNTDEGFEEYEYSMKLKYFNVPVLYSSEIVVYKNQKETLKSIAIKDYQNRYKAFITFLNNFNLLFRGRLSVREHIFSLIYPSGTIYTAFCAALYYSKVIDPKFIIGLLIVKYLLDFKCLVLMRSGLFDYYNLVILFFLSPIIYVRSMLVGFLHMPERKKEEKQKYTPSTPNFEKATVEATITNGKSEFPCKLEITKSDENARAVFIFNDKTLKSSKHPRAYYAVEEIIQKLKAHGFSLKVCANCGYFHFTESTSAHTDGEQGYCLYKNFKSGSKEKESSPSWHACCHIIPHQAGNYIRHELGLDKK